MADQARGSLGWGTFWMVLLPLLLCWLPGLGGLIGGVVGGKVAGNVGRALQSWLISTLIVGATYALFGTALMGIITYCVAAFVGGTPPEMGGLGFILGLGAFMLAVADSGGRLLGALIGGAIA